MAIAATHKTSGQSDTDATSASTASISPTSNALVLAWVFTGRAAGTPPAPTLSGNGLTWVQVATILDASSELRLTLFRAMGASPSAGAVTIDCGATTIVAWLWSIVEFTGVDTSGTNGSGAVVQSKTGSAANATSLTVTLDAAFSAGGNRPAGGVFANDAATIRIVPETDWVELGESDLDASVDLDDIGIQSQWRDAQDTSCGWTEVSTVNKWLGIIVEIKSSGTTETLSIGGTLTSTGTLSRQANTKPAGAITPSGTLVRVGNKSITGTLTSAGTVKYLISHLLSGVLTLAGTLSNLRTAYQTLTGALTSIGTLTRQANAIYSGALTSAGVLVRQSNTTYSGALTPTGVLTLVRVAVLTVSGVLTTAGTIVYKVNQVLTSTLTTSGNLIHLVLLSFAGTLTSSGTLTSVKLAFVTLTGALTPTGNLVRQVNHLLSGTLTTAGSAYVTLFGHEFVAHAVARLRRIPDVWARVRSFFGFASARQSSLPPSTGRSISLPPASGRSDDIPPPATGRRRQ